MNLHKTLYALTCGLQQQPVHTKYLSKKYQRLKYKQWKCKLREGGDAVMNNMSLEHKTSIVADLMEVTLARFITLAVNDCVF